MIGKELTLEEWKSVYGKVPRICVDLVIKGREGVVLVKRGGHDSGPGKGKWHLPGKGIKFGESVEHAIRRTALDETGLRVRVKKFVGYYEYLPPLSFGHPISLVFLVEAVGGRLHDRDGRETGYFRKLPKDMAFDHDKVLKKAGFG